MFTPSADTPFVAMPAAIDMNRRETILACLRVLQDAAAASGGLDYLEEQAVSTHDESGNAKKEGGVAPKGDPDHYRTNGVVILRFALDAVLRFPYPRPPWYSNPQSEAASLAAAEVLLRRSLVEWLGGFPSAAQGTDGRRGQINSPGSSAWVTKPLPSARGR